MPLLNILCLAVLCVLLISGCSARKTTASRHVGANTPSDNSTGAEESSTPNAAQPSTNAPTSKPSRDANPRNPAASSPSSAFTEEGNASWYGIPFHGRRASNGEIYDMHKLTAAHRTLPFDTIVRVTNLTNGKSTVVRITDRGPFVENRIIDLSMAAAREIESIGPGVVPVHLDILSTVDPEAGLFTVQVGAFRDRGNADRLRERLRASYNPIFVQQYDSPEGLFYRVRVGKVPGEEAAHQFGDQLRSREGFTPLVVRLDEGASGENP